MRTIKNSPWLQRGLYLAAGFGLCALCFVLRIKWMDVVPFRAFEQQPAWLKGLATTIEWLPWLAVFGVVVSRIVMGRQVRAGTYLLGTMVPPVLLVGWLFLGPVFEELAHLKRFDAEAWRSQDASDHDADWPPRLCMVDDLMRSGQLWGKTQMEVEALLGPPAPKGFRFGADSADVHYYLGPERGFIRIDSELLLLNFGEDGKLSGQRLYRD